MDNQIAEYNEFKAKMAKVAEIANFEPDTSTEEGYEKSKRVALDIRQVVGNLERTRKELKAESLEYGRRVDGQAKVIKDALDKMREPHQQAYQAVDQEKKQREARRLADMEKRIADIRATPGLMTDSDSSGLNACLEDMRGNQCEGFYELTEQALEARNAAVEKLEQMFTTALANERRVEELAELKAKQARDEEQRRREIEEQAAIQKAADAKAAEEKAAADAKAAEQQKVIDDLMADKRRREEAEARKAKEVADAQLAANAAAKKAEQDRIEAEKAAQLALEAAKEQAERERIEAEELEKARQADETNRQKAYDLALDAMIDADVGVDMAKLLDFIVEGMIPHVTFKV